MVIVDDASARKLLAEGAICYDLDGGQVTRDGSEVLLPAPGDVIDRPILVCGSCVKLVRSTAEALERQGLPAWQVRAENSSGQEGIRSGSLPAEGSQPCSRGDGRNLQGSVVPPDG